MYKASVQSILYVVIRTGEEEIYGLPNLFEGKSIADFPLVEDNALSELVENGCADMDFDGKTKISSEFEGMIKSCAQSREVAVIDIRTDDGKQHHVSLYFVNKDIISIESIDNEFGGMCSVDYVTKEKIGIWVDSILGNPLENVTDMKKVVLESGVVERCDTKEFIKEGCTKEQADMIIKGIKGRGKILISRKIKNDSETLACSFVLGKSCDMEMEIHYDYKNNKELVHFIPVNRKVLYSKIYEVLDS